MGQVCINCRGADGDCRCEDGPDLTPCEACEGSGNAPDDEDA